MVGGRATARTHPRQLAGKGLAALGLRREDLVLTDRRAYPLTQQWAAALYRQAGDADGLWWTSRQAPSGAAVMLFERRRGRYGGVRRSELRCEVAAEPFLSDHGLERLLRIAEQLDVTVVT